MEVIWNETRDSYTIQFGREMEDPEHPDIERIEVSDDVTITMQDGLPFYITIRGASLVDSRCGQVIVTAKTEHTNPAKKIWLPEQRADDDDGERVAD
ncbi:MAG: hypothetical protein AAGK74_00330 [Chloroflexota bacterium]